MREIPCIPYCLSFWSALACSLYDRRILDCFEPVQLAASYLQRLPYLNFGNQSLYTIHPFRNSSLFEELSQNFTISLLLLTCDSKAERRCLLTVVGTSEACLNNQIALIFVTDSQSFHDSVTQSGTRPEKTQDQLSLRPRKMLSQESKNVLESVEAALAAADPSLLPPLIPAHGHEEHDPLRPKLAEFPMPSALDRWIQCDNVSKFLSTFCCTKGCGAIFSRDWPRRRHEETCVRQPEEEEDGGKFIRFKYSTRELRPKPRLQDRLFSVGYRVNVEDISPSGLVVADTETSQTLLPTSTATEEGSLRGWTKHRIFCFGYSAALNGSEGEMINEVLYARRYPDDYAFIEAIVSRLRELALKHRDIQFARAAAIRQALARDLECVERENKDGYNAQTIRKCLRQLNSRLSTLVVGMYNGGQFDLPLLFNHGYLAALKVFFPQIRLLKRGSRYLSVLARDPDSDLSIRHVDFMLLSIRCSLSAYLESHSKFLSSLGDEEDDEVKTKGLIPYHNIGKSMTADGLDAGYEFTLDDFESPIHGEGNSLGRERERYEAALKDCAGDEAKALAAIGASSVPLQAAEVFFNLQASWHKRGLTSALQVLTDYQVRIRVDFNSSPTLLWLNLAFTCLDLGSTLT